MLEFKDFYEIGKYCSEAWMGHFREWEVAEQAMENWLDYCKVKESMDASTSNLPELLITLKEDLEGIDEYDGNRELVEHIIEGLEEIFEVEE